MKNKIVLSALFLFLGVGVWVGFYGEKGFFLKKEAVSSQPYFEEPSDKEYPFDHFFIQRTYPDFKFDVKAHEQALREVRNQMLQKDGEGFDVPWKLEGPTNIGGRINTVAVHPQNENIMYAGCSRGGVFKTVDGGANWTPMFDANNRLSIGHILLDPQEPNTVYVGTGDPNISQSFSIGDGLYKSTDGGETWENIGLAQQRIITKIRVHPTNSDIIYAATMGNPFERDEHRGLYKTVDGGASWQQILYVAEDAGIIDLVMNPNDPDVLYAASWNRVRNLQESVTYDDDAKIFKTTDGGATWTQLTEGLPGVEGSRIGLDISAQNPNSVVAVYVDENHDLNNVYRTDDGGDNWYAITPDPYNLPENALGGFGWYFGKVVFNPLDDNEIYVLGVGLHKTSDNGATWEEATPPWWTYEVHADKHALVFTQSNAIVLATDGGLYKLPAGSNDWEDIEDIPNTQLYRVAVNPHEDGVYFGGAQDNGTTSGNGDNLAGWERVYGGDGFQTRFHPTDPNIFYVETQRGNISATIDGGYDFNNATDGIDGADRRNWDMPYIISGDNPDVLYTGTYRMYRNSSAPFGFWEPISEDLTDGNIFGNSFHTISSIAQSPLNADFLYAGTSDGNMWRSVDAGNTWENITGDLPERYVTAIQASPHDPNTVYVAHSGYKGNFFEPNLHRSTDLGTTWEVITGDMPDIAVNDVLVLEEDVFQQTLFAATDAGIFATLDGGDTWERLGTGMPLISVFDIEYDPVYRKLIAGTFARSIMSFPLDSIIDFDAVTGVPSDNLPEKTLHVYPNPATDRVFIDRRDDGRSLALAEFTITSMTGQVAKQVQLSTTASKFELDVSDLVAGVYVVTAQDKDFRYVGRLVKR